LLNELIEHVWEDDGDIPWADAQDYRGIGSPGCCSHVTT
jgi:hypothetical protein